MSDTRVTAIRNEAEWKDFRQNIRDESGSRNKMKTALAGGLLYLALTGAAIYAMYVFNGPGPKYFWDLTPAQLLKNTYIIGSAGAGATLIIAAATGIFFNHTPHADWSSADLEGTKNKNVEKYRDHIQNEKTYEQRHHSNLKAMIPELLELRLISTALLEDMNTRMDLIKQRDKLAVRVDKEDPKKSVEFRTREAGRELTEDAERKLDRLEKSHPNLIADLAEKKIEIARHWAGMQENFKNTPGYLGAQRNTK